MWPLRRPNPPALNRVKTKGESSAGEPEITIYCYRICIYTSAGDTCDYAYEFIGPDAEDLKKQGNKLCNKVVEWMHAVHNKPGACHWHSMAEFGYADAFDFKAVIRVGSGMEITTEWTT